MKMARKPKARKRRSRSPRSSKLKGPIRSKRQKTKPTKSISRSKRAGKSSVGRAASRRKPSSQAPEDAHRYSVVRIMGQGQYKLDSATVNELNKIDNEILKLIEEGREGSSASRDPESRFKEKLTDMVSLVTSKGKEVDPKEIVASDFILPPIDATIKEASSLFKGEGIIPG